MTDRQTDRPTQRQTDRYTDRPTETQTERDRQTDQQTDRQTDKQTGQQRDRQTDKQTGATRDTETDMTKDARMHTKIDRQTIKNKLYRGKENCPKMCQQSKKRSDRQRERHIDVQREDNRQCVFLMIPFLSSETSFITIGLILIK